MTCNGCGNPNARRMRITKDYQCCDGCGGLGNVKHSDVYFRNPYFDPNLADPKKPEQKDGVWVESREHKARILKELGLREVGDRRGGAINFDPALARAAKEQGHGPR